MKPSRFEYYDPTSLEEILELLDRYGDDAKLLAGGQSLVPLLNFRLSTPAVLIDVNRVAGLSYIRQDTGLIRTGALTRQRTLEFFGLMRRRLPLLHAQPR